jgi:hypothetical protein
MPDASIRLTHLSMADVEFVLDHVLVELMGYAPNSGAAGVIVAEVSTRLMAIIEERARAQINVALAEVRDEIAKFREGRGDYANTD